MIRIHFISGKVQEIDQPWDKFPQKLTYGGMRLLKGGLNLLIPLNSATIEFVEYVEDEPAEVVDYDSLEAEAEEAKEIPAKIDAPVVEEPKVEEKKESEQERNDRLIKEMMEMSDCHKNKHAGQEMMIYYQDTTIAKKGSKTKVAARRFFPVCPKCGVRERYVKADSLTDEQKANAKIWDK